MNPDIEALKVVLFLAVSWVVLGAVGKGVEKLQRVFRGWKRPLF